MTSSTRDERRKKKREEERRRSEEVDRALEAPRLPSFEKPPTGVIVPDKKK